MNRNLIYEYMFLIIIVFVLYTYKDYEFRNLVLVKSEFNHKSYFVQDTVDKQRSANVIGKIDDQIWELIDKIKKNHSTDEYIQYIDNIYNRKDKIQMMEVPFETDDTSYTLHKHKLVFCLKEKNGERWGEYHDYNLIMYVVLHEISHIACPETGHTELFGRIFNYIATKAIHYGFYHKIDFVSDPKNYCGMVLNTSIV